MVREDPIFDEYLEKDDDGTCIESCENRLKLSVLEPEPRRQRPGPAELTLDLLATQEDHTEVMNGYSKLSQLDLDT